MSQGRAEKPLQERAEKTRQDLLLAAAQVFDEVGFRASRIKDIYLRAGTSQGSFYFHFKSKLDIAMRVMLDQRDAVTLPPGTKGLQLLIDTCMWLAYLLQTNAPLQAGVRLAVEQEEIGFRNDEPYQLWVTAFSEQLEAAAERGELKPDVEIHRLALLLVGAYTGVQHFSRLREGRADLRDRIADLWEYLLPGVAHPEIAGQIKIREIDPKTVLKSTDEPPA